MVHAEITSTEPSSNKEYVQSLSQTVNLTPERAHRWNTAAFPAISTLRAGTRACAVIVGESPERRVLLQRDTSLKRFKIRLVQRELIADVRQTSLSVYSTCSTIPTVLSTVWKQTSKFSNSHETIVGRTAFYNDFLLEEKDLLEEFLSDSYSTPL
jgi:hypothetical protein